MTTAGGRNNGPMDEETTADKPRGIKLAFYIFNVFFGQYFTGIEIFTVFLAIILNL